MKILGVIPARYGSTRFPGKPLTKIDGKAMILHVYERAFKSGLFDQLYIATDHDSIYQEAIQYGAKVKMTRSDHQSGTDRCSEVAKLFPQMDYVVNIQGDEPRIAVKQLETLVQAFNQPEVEIVTLKKKINNIAEKNNPNVVKVVTDNNNNALYFSRSLIPFPRNQDEDLIHFKHIGLYGFKRQTLMRLTKLAPTHLEMVESLEQLRWLENGFPIRVLETELESIAIDTPDDLKKL
jgi:3-deoxy-manno-octulosonate cytidylyltransferase (CMP-KDO synthetase)